MFTMNKKAKKIIKVIGLILLSIFIIAAGYFAYVVGSYHRIEDNIPLEVVSAVSQADMAGGRLSKDGEYTVVTYNVGFGAYSPDFSFFMDGGKSSWAKDKATVINNINGAGDLALSFDPDFILLQEIDTDSTRSYHQNELILLQNKLAGYDNTFAVNYDSAFLLYPLYQPHGASKAGLGTFSRYSIKDSVRRSLPISEGFSRFLDLDRAYSVNRISVDNGRELVLINIHMSAYGSSAAVREGQTSMLKEELEREYKKGNYVIVGGDFNHDLMLSEDTEAMSWAHAYDRALLPEHFSFALDGLSEAEREALNATCRDAKTVYYEGCDTYVIDGFIISDNIRCITYENASTGFSFSDHEPVVMTFSFE